MKNYYEKKSIHITTRDAYRIHSERFDAQQLAELLNVTLQTAYKYLSDQHAIDASKRELLEIKGLGKIPFDGWDGYYFDRNGRLIGRNGYSLTSEEIANFHYVKQLSRMQQIEINKLTQRIAELERERAFDNVVPFIPA
jgi:transcriptional regulator with XRE-family HTH domain